MQWPALVKVVSYYDSGPQMDEILLSIAQATTDCGASALLPHDAVQGLREALTSRSPWASVPEPQGTWAELGWQDGSARLAVIGYGHEWKRIAVQMFDVDVDALAAALADWLANGWARCRQVVLTPPRPAPEPVRPPCRPTGDLADPGASLDGCGNGRHWICAVCGTPMRAEWSPVLTDWVELADDGSMFGSIKPPHGENGYEYLAWLRDRAAAGDDRAAGDYSMLSVVLGLSGDPFSHRHRIRSKSCTIADCVVRRPDPPWCCDQPMWLTGEGWRCRVGRRSFPFTPASAMSA
jgi:hypothetical protein